MTMALPPIGAMQTIDDALIELVVSPGPAALPEAVQTPDARTPRPPPWRAQAPRSLKT
ncbi:hypothetical protein XFF6166_120069 [Xanthomonas citri pv. fuscans]|uniref:Uncharacterized protein n=1 Tax=Xanthomonas campestris pv. phaseoli TaxID=317013 RepID=A0A7Z7J303_XANCH|nr:hypothetical protein XFF6166_120069 [Xanthomonas citri pv. fuscans]SOO26382.1 hypothetical protein XFF6991_540042 [Xanthomonas phaseoli pv. phaseoli]SON94961.1 hypothetical protein XFF7767_10039 [Xanthomonas citri pv. fuscans]SON95808.1 hypothetical protein XFF6990_280034 [Xanthomonas citri pv. fuscans]SON99287.1 hypothetical protein XFF6960_160038 [Xanthomonas citri pv. fuscans]